MLSHNGLGLRTFSPALPINCTMNVVVLSPIYRRCLLVAILLSAGVCLVINGRPGRCDGGGDRLDDWWWVLQSMARGALPALATLWVNRTKPKGRHRR